MATHGDRHPTDMAGLRGARIVTSIETEQGSRWAESKLKALTGGDKITARFMRQDFFEFMPQFKLLIVGNHKPSIRNVDEAMRRRLHMVPFTVTIPPAKRDKRLPDRLLAERDGILAWALARLPRMAAQRASPAGRRDGRHRGLLRGRGRRRALDRGALRSGAGLPRRPRPLSSPTGRPGPRPTASTPARTSASPRP